MIAVEIRTQVDAITVAAPLGMTYIQPHSYPQLCFSESGQPLHDDTYLLKQGDRREICSVINGRVRGAEWVNPNLPLDLL